MTQKELIRQEIERRKKICEGIFERESDTYYQGKAVAYGELLPFIDSLPEEKLSYVTDSPGDPGNPGEPGISDDLKEAAEKYADKHGFRVPYDGSNNYYDDVDVKVSKEGFLAGAEWMAKQGVTFTAAVDHYEDFYLDSYDQEAEAIKKNLV